MPVITLIVNHPAGLHARPAALFVKMAKTFSCDITVRKIDSEKPSVNAKNILSVLTLGINQGSTIEVEAQGDGAEIALQSLKKLVESNFGEN